VYIRNSFFHYEKRGGKLLMYQFTLYRPRDPWRDFVLSGEGIRLGYNAGQENGFAMLGRVLTWLGRPDGEVLITESNGGEFTASLPSSHRLTTLPVGTAPITQDIYIALCQPAKHLATLIARDMATGDGSLTDKGILTKESHEVIKTEEDQEAKKVWLTTQQCDMFRIVRDTPPRFASLHGKSRNYAIRSGWVEMVDGLPVMTALGAEVYDNFMNRKNLTVSE
jgi:hypothetical protein